MLFACCLTLDLRAFLLIGAIVFVFFCNFWYTNVYQMTAKMRFEATQRGYHVIVPTYVLKDLILDFFFKCQMHKYILPLRSPTATPSTHRAILRSPTTTPSTHVVPACYPVLRFYNYVLPVLQYVVRRASHPLRQPTIKNKNKLLVLLYYEQTIHNTSTYYRRTMTKTTHYIPVLISHPLRQPTIEKKKRTLVM